MEVFEDGERLGWCVQVQPTTVTDEESKNTLAALDVYMLTQEGTAFKVTKRYQPYFYIVAKEYAEREVEVGLKGAFNTLLADVVPIEKEDLDMPNHLSGKKRKLLKLLFSNVSDLCQLRDVIKQAVAKNQVVEAEALDFDETNTVDPLDRLAFLNSIVDVKEFDVKYHVRVAIDLEIRVGLWYRVKAEHGNITFTGGEDLINPVPKICAFDIECSKAPLKFPDAQVDPIYMISYMLDTQGYLIINRDIVTEDIDDFEYTPKPEYEGPFIVFNEKDEEAMLQRWFSEMKLRNPDVYVTFNGDFFDMPYVNTRAQHYGIDMKEELGFTESDDGEWLSQKKPHIDCLYWVKRDSYLPQGSQGLKAVTKAKLGYDPLEIDPEDMLKFAQERPQHMASYSVSDAVATYYLYMKYIHPFIFSLCTIIPMPPDEVLRKGSGTCCETLLMVQAYQKNIVFPNKQVAEKEKFYNNHLLESETYIGGHVDAIRSGVFRADHLQKFALDSAMYQTLIDRVDNALKFAIEVEGGLKMEEVTNYEEVRDDILRKLSDLRDNPYRQERPLIYHLDVGAMYPNIILTNRLQPPSMVHEQECAACVYNRPENDCQRRMQWMWRGEYFMANKSEFMRIKHQLENERFLPAQIEALNKGNIKKKGRQAATPGAKKKDKGTWRKDKPSIVDRMGSGARAWGKKDWIKKKFERREQQQEEEDPDRPRRFHELTADEQILLVKKRLGEYSRKAYKKTHATKEIRVDSTVCQRENPFFVDTVRAFRDRRYVYKGLTKKWVGELNKAKEGKGEHSLRECQSRAVLYESLQLAHKCILNSFYGYVMRKGSRWYSMEMGGVVTHLGANIIKMARELTDRIGLSLELDTDGIWCCLPATFPENYTFTTTNEKKKKYNISYPCVMLNEDVNKKFTNAQYQDWDPEKKEWVQRSECSIFFEVDGPYLAMVLPASREEGKSIKKRYAVFNHDKSLAELKGFELKRRGELKLIKVFQSQVFPKFAEGSTLQECYAAVAKVANDHLDILYSKGGNLDTDELMDLILESRTMSNALSDYPATQKSLALTTARRLAEFLGPQMVKDKGLNCTYVIAKKPESEPVTTRAIPLAIFSAEQKIKRYFLARWLKDGALGEEVDVRDILDWNYYIERLGAAIQKIITIPAAFQDIPNPVPRVLHPGWLGKRVAAANSRYQQKSLDGIFKPRAKGEDSKENINPQMDMEDMGAAPTQSRPGTNIVWNKKTGKRAREPAAAPAPEPEAPLALSAAFTRTYIGAQSTQDFDAAFFQHPEFRAWLQLQKQQWRRQAQDRQMVSTGELPMDKRLRQVVNNRAGDRTAARNVAQYLDGARAKLVNASWEVLEVRQSPDLPDGTLKAFVLIDGNSVQTVKIHVPRQVYVNSREAWDAEQVGAKPVSYTLPRRKQVHHLYELEFDETQYNADHITNLSLMAEVEGVYERHVSPCFRAVLHLGCVVSVNKQEYVQRVNSDRQGNADVFRLPELTTDKPDTPYLQGNELQYVYLYHSFSETEARGIIAVVFVKQKQVRTVFVQPPRAARQTAAEWSRLTQTAVGRTQTQGTQMSEDADGSPLDTGRLGQFDFVPPEYVDSKINAFRRADGWLMEFLAVSRPVLTFCQGSTDLDIQTQVPSLSNVPVRTLIVQKSDLDLYRHANVFKVFESAVMDRIVDHYCAVLPHMEQCLQMCRYSNIPLCNLDNDLAVGVMDVSFGRLLRNNSHLLWCTSGARPDLGGTEADDNKFTTCEEVLASLQPTDINSPGAHLTYSVNLDISHLEVMSVTYSQSIMDSDISSLQLQQESTQVLSAFNIMREMISHWYADALSGAAYAAAPDMLLQHVFRWLKNKSSLLYDPALYRFTLQLVKKAFSTLLQRILKVGSKIIFANFQRVVINTPKASIVDAQSYVNFLLSAVKDNILLQRLSLTPSAYYTTLLWMDRMNYAVFQTAEEDVQGALPEGPFSPNVVLSLSGYFPEAAGKRYQDNIVRFMTAVTNFKTELLQAEQAKPQAEQAGREALMTRCEQYMQTFVQGSLQQRLMQDVEKMAKLGTARYIMSKRPGSSWMSSDCPLEYIKALCHLLGLYPSLNSTIYTMKGNLLKLVGVKAFDSAATFVDPSGAALVLSDVMCSYCNEVMDIDLVRDDNFAPDKDWACLVCRKPFSRDLIEAQLVDQLGLSLMAYQVQDLQCVKCKQVKADYLITYCSCSGEYRPKTTPEALMRKVRNMLQIAEYHGLQWLQEVTTWALQQHGESVAAGE